MSSSIAAVTSQFSTDGYNPVIVTNANGVTLAELCDGTNTFSNATFYTVPVPVDYADSYRFQFTCPATGTPVGTIQLQGTIDKVVNNTNKPNAADQPAANWAPLSFSVNGAAFTNSFTLSSATQVVVDENRVNYGYVRAVITLASGTVTPTIKMLVKGARGR